MLCITRDIFVLFIYGLWKYLFFIFIHVCFVCAVLGSFKLESGLQYSVTLGLLLH